MRTTLPNGTPVEVARPHDGEATGGLVLCPDIMGLRPLFDEMAQRLADENGWVVVVPEPYPGREALTLDERLASVGEFDDLKVMATLQQAADATGMHDVGVLGFCMGGMWALKASATGRFHHAVSFYGMIRMPDQWRSDTQWDALDYVTSPGACPVLELVGTEDPFVPLHHVAELQEADAEVHIYEGAEHGFVHDASRPAHRPEDAADAWSRAITFLQEPA
ncbi:MAG TPA: dienelactone hydrolase family protein [Acidimicrobiales bacterium]|nr:dienelactone hydrolase family protein [Acidimicrobiales bacterium]